jgi:hypothetical protein
VGGGLKAGFISVGQRFDGGQAEVGACEVCADETLGQEKLRGAEITQRLDIEVTARADPGVTTPLHYQTTAGHERVDDLVKAGEPLPARVIGGPDLDLKVAALGVMDQTAGARKRGGLHRGDGLGGGDHPQIDRRARVEFSQQLVGEVDDVVSVTATGVAPTAFLQERELFRRGGHVRYRTLLVRYPEQV